VLLLILLLLVVVAAAAAVVVVVEAAVVLLNTIYRSDDDATLYNVANSVTQYKQQPERKWVQDTHLKLLVKRVF
jgi:signal transduction histidine kinase